MIQYIHVFAADFTFTFTSKQLEKKWRPDLHLWEAKKSSRLIFLVLTTVSQSGGWVPDTSRSFHYWQPAPRWSTLPWLTNPGNAAMRPHAEGGKKNRHPSHWLNSGKKGKDRGGDTASKESPPSEKCWLKRQQNCYNALWTKNTRNPGACAYI